MRLEIRDIIHDSFHVFPFICDYGDDFAIIHTTGWIISVVHLDFISEGQFCTKNVGIERYYAHAHMVFRGLCQ